MNSAGKRGWLDKKIKPAEARCECGQLIAKIRGDNLELKCKRCKRIISISYNSLKETDVISAPCGQ